MGGISIWQLLIILAIVLLLFGAKRIRSLGSDVGTSIKGFREAMRDGDKDDSAKSSTDSDSQASAYSQSTADGNDVINGEVVKEKDRA